MIDIKYVCFEQNIVFKQLKGYIYNSGSSAATKFGVYLHLFYSVLYLPVYEIVHAKYMLDHTNGRLTYVQDVLETGDIFIT